MLFCCSLFATPYLAASGQTTDRKREAIEQLVPDAVDRDVDFVADVQPILKNNCYECHSGETEEGGLNLAIKVKALEGGEHGPVWIAGDSLSSLVLHLVSGADKDRIMPPEDNDPLSPEQIGVLRAWIDQGATWPDDADVLDPRLDRAKEHWAFQRLRAVDVPAKRDNDAWSQTDIDLFVREKLTANQINPRQPQTLESSCVGCIWICLACHRRLSKSTISSKPTMRTRLLQRRI